MPVAELLSRYTSPEGAAGFFAGLGYQTLESPLPLDLSPLPEGARTAVRAVDHLVDMGGGTFRVFHVELGHGAIRRTDIRRFLEAFYTRYPQGDNLFVFSPAGTYDELAFVSPVRLLDPRNHARVRLWLRILRVRRDRP